MPPARGWRRARTRTCPGPRTSCSGPWTTCGLEVPPGGALDAGASTGGFTQVLLERGCAPVLRRRRGHEQLAPSLRADPRVVVQERTNLRDLTLDHVDGVPVDLVVADVSFISLTLLVGTAGGGDPRRRRAAADGEAAVRGGPGAAGPRRRRPRARAAPARPSTRCWPPPAPSAGTPGPCAQPAAGPGGEPGVLRAARRRGPRRPGRRRRRRGLRRGRARLSQPPPMLSRVTQASDTARAGGPSQRGRRPGARAARSGS